MSAGKGDARRPYDANQYGKNYDNIFRKVVADVCSIDPECKCTEESTEEQKGNDEI
jgi:hypothetical protein